VIRRHDMPSHQPADYHCPFCNVVSGGETDRNRQADVVARDELTTALIAPKWWPNNRGHVLVIPNRHYENLYDVPDNVLAAISATAKKVAVALRTAYGCEGTSTRQHNEPAGGQDVWHFHVHVFPRYEGDNLYQRHDEPIWATPEERAPYAERLRRAVSLS
jgi:histidine triad (HIT) family protein